MTAGYLNYTSNFDDNMDVETSSKIEAKDDLQIANIGDARLVNSNAISENEDENETQSENKVEKSDTETSNNLNTNNTTSNESENKNNSEENSAINMTVETNSNATNNSNEYFIKSKLDRDTMYSQMIETYEKILNSSNSLETQKQSATEEITKINETKNSIMICENLIETKGFQNCVIFVNSDSDSVSVIINAEELKQEEIAQIQNIISRELNAKIENIHISMK